MKATLEMFRGDCDVVIEVSDASSYFQTTIRMGKSDMHELTKSAVEMALGVGFLGGAGNGAALIPEFASRPSWSLASSPNSPPSFQTPASQRTTRCCDRVVMAQKNK